MPPKPLTTDKLSFVVPMMTGSLWQAVGAGMGAMIGAGIFVGLGIAAEEVDRHLLESLLLAALVALGSGLSRSQLVSYHRQVYTPITQGKSPHSDVYGYSEGLLNSWLGFAAAWSLALALAATAATAAIGASGYLFVLLPVDLVWQIPIALLIVFSLAALLWRGLRPLQQFKRISTAIGVLTLLFFTIAGLRSVGIEGVESTFPVEESGVGASSAVGLVQVFRATSLLVVAFAGYGQIARLAQTPQTPRWSVGKASGWTLIMVLLLYGGVAIAAVAAIGTVGLRDAVEAYGAPLAIAARTFTIPGSLAIVAVGASLTLLGTVSYLLVELVRVLWMMGQRRDLPRSLAQINSVRAFPPFAVLWAGGSIAFIVLSSDLQSIWNFAAFGFLLHTAITNLAMAQLPAGAHRYLRWFALISVALCIFLIFWLDWRVWLLGAGLVVVGLVWRGINLWVIEQSDESG
ncbi:APC family permease [Egbenema bharatensis]|uniref:APC family permease n=1 Tax=Egbenema bharatensis TaxID=3463334 RepID=UPI003A85725A